jgi:hypothetical protein
MKKDILLASLIVCVILTVSCKSDPNDLDEQNRDLCDANTS